MNHFKSKLQRSWYLTPKYLGMYFLKIRTFFSKITIPKEIDNNSLISSLIHIFQYLLLNLASGRVHPHKYVVSQTICIWTPIVDISEVSIYPKMCFIPVYVWNKIQLRFIIMFGCYGFLVSFNLEIFFNDIEFLKNQDSFLIECPSFWVFLISSYTSFNLISLVFPMIKAPSGRLIRFRANVFNKNTT